MDFRHRVFGFGLDALSLGKVDRWLPVPSDAAGFVLTLHHVRPERRGEFDPNRHLSVTPEFLDLIITQFRAEGWEFVSVDDLTRIAVGRTRDRRQIAITVDDGFEDVFRYALPVFRRRQVPFTVYIVPGFCDGAASIWWEALERIIAKKYEVGIEGDDLPPPLFCRTADEKAAAFDMWAKWFCQQRDEDYRRGVIERLAEANQVDLKALTDELVMSWDEIREIGSDTLCTLGAHTMTHPSLALLSEKRAMREIGESGDRIEAETGIWPDSIAFPYGNKASAGVREAVMARQCGFDVSFSTRSGYVPRTGARHLLPRISVNGCLQKSSYFRTLLTPGIWAFRDTFSRRPALAGI